ncbi:MAG TPA: hypothetical protein DCW29_24830 [Janthinobacterium sp.]|nr:hypothetical protein [Janthinobacterium sp.]
MRLPFRRQRGVALPVMLIMLGVMLISSVYLLKASTSSTLATSNLAYEASLGKAVDLGLLTGFQWLNTTAAAAKTTLEADVPASSYVSTFAPGQSVSDPAFWVGAAAPFDDGAGNQVQFVIHRMCKFAGNYISVPNQNCMQTAPNTKSVSNVVALGASLASDAVVLAGLPQIHYIVTARIFGARGGNVVNQTVVMIGA